MYKEAVPSLTDRAQ
jgi:hypothetical protein